MGNHGITQLGLIEAGDKEQICKDPVFFLSALFQKTVNRLASENPVTWVWQTVPGAGSIAFCGLHCSFLSVIQKEGKRKYKGRFAERAP